MANTLPSLLSDHDLLIETHRAAASERGATASLLALLAEVDSRRLYLGEGFSSLFAYATQRLQLSEPAAYSRITAARAARRFPIVLPLLDEGAVSLTTVSLLAAHLTEENHAELLAAASHKSKRDVERLVAALHPQPDIASSVRALPISRPTPMPSPPATSAAVLLALPSPKSPLLSRAASPARDSDRRPALVAPLAPRRYLIRVTVTEETRDKLRQATDLLRHAIPDGDPAAIVDRALTVLLEQLSRTKIGTVTRPRSATRRASGAGAKTRHVPASVRRDVWKRDQGRCAFLGPAGRCSETGRLEFHHVVPFAKAGPATVENLQLRCRAHNAYEGELMFGDWRERARTKSSGAGELCPDGVG